MACKILVPLEKIDRKRFNQLKVDARSIIARMEVMTGDGQTIHDRNGHVSFIRNLIAAIERNGEHMLYGSHNTLLSTGRTKVRSYTSYVTLDYLAERIERARSWASRHGA